jgi:23S rRNA pseudouridine1911/1915/1917 synthase
LAGKFSATMEDPHPAVRSFVVGEDEEHQRLDSFLSSRFEDRSRSHLKKLIQEGFVQVNGRVVKPGYEVRPRDQVSVRLPTADTQTDLDPEWMDLDVLHEDDDIVVVNKAPGVVVHPGAGHEESTLVHGLLAHCPRLAMQGAPRRPGIVHRLDQYTSGALVVAKSEIAYLDLIAQFKRHSVGKEYLALVYGRFSQPRGEIKTLMDRHPVDRKRMAVVTHRGREAVSKWWVEQELGEVTLLRVVIETGRTHQIRVHLSHLHHPVVGDATYGGGKRKAKSLKSSELQDLLLPVDRQMLHAYRLSFQHPRTHDPIAFTAPLPPDFDRLLQNLKRLHLQ